jgi:hypothetical protein
MASSFTKFPDDTQRRTTVGRTPLDEWSDLHIDLYLTKLNTHSRETSMPMAGFATTIPVRQRPQTHDVVRAATGTGNYYFLPRLYGRQSSSTCSQKPASCLYAVQPTTLNPMPLRSIFCYPRPMRNLSKRYLFYVSSYQHPPPLPVLSSPYMSRPSFTTWVHHTYKVW